MSDLLSQARQTRGPGAYVALRELWRRWDQIDPTPIEEALLAVERDTSAEPAVRSYAGMLSAYARRRRGDLEGAKRKLKSLGFIDRWLIVGPFDNEAKASLFTRFGPEEDLSRPIVVGQSYEGKERPVAWRSIPEYAAFGWLDLGNMLRPSEKVCAYATSFVRARPTDDKKPGPSRATLWIGAAGAFRAFWNGDEVLVDLDGRALDADRLAAQVSVKPGWNRLTVKVCGDEEGPMLQARIGNEQGGPSSLFEFRADAALSSEAASHSKPARPAASRAPKTTPGVRIAPKNDPYARGSTGSAIARLPAPWGGPLAGIGKLVADKNASPEALEASARYLATTSGDARGQHTARDLAIRAAEASPSVSRYLFAAELAEDRNARAAWLTRARALVEPGSDDTEVTLAEALLARSGTNFRDATPFFDRILARNPGHIPALLGRAELFEEAGLRRSALVTLEQAVQRSPHSVALLRSYAHQLRTVGRASDAEDVERRYANLRFDDVTFLRNQIELAVARRDIPAGTRWVERLLELDPESLASLELAARALRALGQKERAILTLERRLELAPEDVDALRALAEMQGEDGKQDAQLKLLRRVLALRPQAKDIREYLEHSQPPKIRRDEAFAWEKEQILALAQSSPPPGGFARRTLRELQVTTVYPNGLASRFHQVVFQPLTEEGAAAGRQYAFPYQADREVVDMRGTRVYRASGKIDEATETGEGPADNPALAMYTSTRTFYVQLPRLAVGDVVELRYRVEEVAPRNEFGDSFSETAYLQGSEPTANTEYVLVTPKSRKINVRAITLPNFTREETDEGDLHLVRLTGKDVAPIFHEPLMPPFAEQALNTGASTFASWDDVGKWFWGLSKDQFDADEEVRKKVAELTKGLTTDLEKVRAVYDFVVQRTRYVALEFGIEGFRPRRCALTLARGWGDCKDKATVIVTMLRELGIDASMVLVRTNMRGDTSPEPPSYAFFDHAIAYVPKLDLFLDGTAEYTGMNEFPPFDRGALGLIVDASGAKLVRLPEPAADATIRSRKIEVTLPESGPASIDAQFQATGAIAAEWRQQFHAVASQRARITEELGAEFGGLSLASGAQGLDVNDLENIEQPVKIRMKGQALGMARSASGDFTFSASPIGSLVSRFAPLSTRRYDVKLPFAHGFDDEWTVKLSGGTHVKHTPDEKTIQSPFGRLELKFDKQPSRLVVKTKLRLDKTRIKPDEYAAFRAFCEEIDRALGDRIVLGK